MLKTYEDLGLDGVVTMSVGIGGCGALAWRAVWVAYVPGGKWLDLASFAQCAKAWGQQELLAEMLCVRIFEDLEEALAPTALRVVVLSRAAEDASEVTAIKEYNWGRDADTLTVLREEMDQR